MVGQSIVVAGDGGMSGTAAPLCGRVALVNQTVVTLYGALSTGSPITSIPVSALAEAVGAGTLSTKHPTPART